MSGFDFGSLRDPDSPQPGASQREGVAMRARQLQLRARRGRVIVGVLALAVVGAGVAGIVVTRSKPRSSVTVTGPNSTTAPASSTTTSIPVGYPTSSTTTTTVPAASSGAVSASFVSESRGWVVETDGRIDGTTDGGRHWSVAGQFPTRGPNTTIRFADASVGFGFNPYNVNRLYRTTDGGASWTRLETPFSNVYDLAISRGVVYAVSFDQSAARFRIWSTPADQLAWVEDPLVIPVGAGPIPSIQLVFSNGEGWLIEVDRVVVAGARMAPGGHWSAWTPPCASVNGPAFLAAWSASDLITTCDEGVWGPPPQASAVYVSHDAGATFLRRAAPVFGAVAAADPNYAVIVKGGTIRRSDDGGRTWNVVVTVTNTSADQPLDLGFTSSAQGFVIFSNGQMFMTYASGATWNAVTLP